MSMLTILGGSWGLSFFFFGKFSIWWITSSPAVARPNIYSLEMYDVRRRESEGQYGMFSIEPGRSFRRNEELWSVCVWSSISHTQSIFRMFQIRDFIFEFSAPDTFSTSPITQRIPSLNHKPVKCQYLQTEKRTAYLGITRWNIVPS